ncbi:amino acid/amide ABC transporter substrate-binding protein, HAAT family [Collimonas sp. OK607]|uniref:ABC transporter substrate-binding protein n=1 Tax=Collimonas sp. OK607 TaxID=1798194 RepID=UPI0008F056FE|nr:ABC transporter substrate-binding protein [Collimonas sp. OK607]SFB00813.1 amino acid/amide ABC transporter substrate-binding protein, HAAT family [Collimonas sp. OK607]
MFSKAFFIALFSLSASVAAGADDIVITQVASATHPVSRENAKGAAVGFEAFFARINASGGVNGRKVVLDVRDDHFIPPQTVSLVKETISGSKSLALFATVGTANLAELIKSGTLTANDMALVGPISGLPVLLGAPNVFPVRASYIDELRQIVKHSRTILRKRAVFLHLDTPLAADLTKELAIGMEEDGRQLLDSIAIAPVSDTGQMKQNVLKAVGKALISSPDMCVVFGPGSIGPAVIDAMREKIGQRVTIYLMSSSSADDIIRMSGVQNANGVIISQALPLPTDAGNRSVRQYLADMKRYAPKEQVSHLTLEGYLGARILYEGIKRASSNLTRTSLLASLNSLGKFDIGDFEVNYSANGKHGSTLVDMTLINKSGYLVH